MAMLFGFIEINMYNIQQFVSKKTLPAKCLKRLTCIYFFHLRPLILYLRKFYYYDPEEETYLSIKGMRQAAGVEQEAESET